jgi:hypothetical protein
MKAKFTGHDTFPLRYGWLYKAVNHMNSGGKLQTSKEKETQEAIIKLGVGKNMVNAIRYWADSAGLLKSKKEQNSTIYYSSDNGNYIFNKDKGKDPYLEHIGSIWLIHLWLCSDQNEMTAYRYFFNVFNGEYFEKKILLTHISDDIKKYSDEDKSVNENTIQKDIDTFLNTYCKKLNQNSKTGDEEQFNSPLSELNLIQDSGKNFYLSDLNEKNDLPIEIFIYSVIKFVKEKYKISNTCKVNFDTLLLEPYSPGRIFRLSEQGLASKLNEAQNVSKNKISWLDNLGLRQISVEESYMSDAEEILEEYYKGCANE